MQSKIAVVMVQAIFLIDTSDRGLSVSIRVAGAGLADVDQLRTAETNAPTISFLEGEVCLVMDANLGTSARTSSWTVFGSVMS